MGNNLYLIIALEAVAICIFVIFILLLQNRKLRRQRDKLKATDNPPPKTPSTPKQESSGSLAQLQTYGDQLAQQVELTKTYHSTLDAHQNIAIDLDPEAPLERRTAALRHAVLIAEIEAVAQDEGAPQWDRLSARYQQIWDFHEDYRPGQQQGESEESPNNDEAQELKESLHQAQKRINNLERFKVMYLELDQRWQACRGQANEHYTELRNLAADSDNADDLHKALETYHAIYNDIGEIIAQGADTGINSGNQEEESQTHLQEIRRLREVATNQHRIITELQTKLSSEASGLPHNQILDGLQSELHKQTRFLKESETCIQLMEDELATAKRELFQLRSRLNDFPKINGLVKTLQATSEHQEELVEKLQSDNRRLSRQLQQAQQAPPEDNLELRKLRKELADMQGKYNELEEQFLDMKLK